MAAFTLTDSTPTDDTGDGGEKKVYDIIPAGTKLVAEVLNAEVRDSFFWIDVEDHSKGKQKQVAFKFGIMEEGPYKGWKIFGDTPTTFNNNEKCKLRHWVEEIFAFDSLPSGFQFDTDDLVGEPVYVIVGNRSYNDKKTGEQVTKMFVENVIRYGGGFEESTADAF